MHAWGWAPARPVEGVRRTDDCQHASRRLAHCPCAQSLTISLSHSPLSDLTLTLSLGALHSLRSVRSARGGRSVSLAAGRARAAATGGGTHSQSLSRTHWEEYTVAAHTHTRAHARNGSIGHCTTAQRRREEQRTPTRPATHNQAVEEAVVKIRGLTHAPRPPQAPRGAPR